MAIAALALLALPSAPALAAKKPSAEAAALPGGFGVRPLIPKGANFPPSYFVLDAKPGETIERTVVIVNGTKKTKTLIVDGVDGITGATSGTVYANRGDRHLETSRWLRPGKRVVHVDPGTSERMRFRVKIPDGARPGDHVAGLAFEDRHVSTSKSRFSVKQVVRVVVGVQIHIDGGTPGQATLGKMSMQAQPGTEVATTVVQLGNSGDKLCKPKLAVTIQPQNGEPRTVERQLDTVLPRDTVAYPMQFTGQVQEGTYGATAKVSGCGEERTATATVRLDRTLDGSAPQAKTPSPAKDDSPLSGVPSWLLIGGLVILGIGGGIGGLLFVQALARRRRAPKVQEA